MKKSIVFIIIGILAVSSVFSADSDNFDIVVTCSYLDISLMQSWDHGTPYGTWNLGILAPGAAPVAMTTAEHIWVSNGSNTPLDFSAYVESPVPAPCGFGTPTAWTPGVTADTDQFRLELGVGAPDAEPLSYTDITATTAPGNEYLSGADAGVSHDLYTRFTVPTATTDGCEHTLTVTVTISVH